MTTYLLGGYSLGKAIFGLKVVDLYDKDLSLWTIVSRRIFGGYLMYRFKILYLIAAATDYNQNPGDTPSRYIGNKLVLMP